MSGADKLWLLFQALKHTHARTQGKPHKCMQVWISLMQIRECTLGSQHVQGWRRSDTFRHSWNIQKPYLTMWPSSIDIPDNKLTSLYSYNVYLCIYELDCQAKCFKSVTKFNFMVTFWFFLWIMGWKQATLWCFVNNIAQALCIVTPILTHFIVRMTC